MKCPESLNTTLCITQDGLNSKGIRNKIALIKNALCNTKE